MGETYSYHGYTITITSGLLHLNVTITSPEGRSVTAPHDDAERARRWAQYYVRLRERGQEERDGR